MSTLSKLFSGYTGGGQIVKNGKFSTTKNNHNRNKYGKPTVIHGYSRKYLKIWFGNNFNNMMKEASELLNPQFTIKCMNNGEKRINNLPSYLNPNYRRSYYPLKHTY